MHLIYIHIHIYICIANCYITRQLQLKFHKSKTGETVRSVHHICAPNIVKLTDFWLKYSRKGGCFYWETVYIHVMTIFQLLAFQNQQPVPLLVGWLVLCASWTQDYVMHIKFKCRQSGSLTNTVQLNTLLFKNFRTWLLDLASALPLAKGPLEKSS